MKNNILAALLTCCSIGAFAQNDPQARGAVQMGALRADTLPTFRVQSTTDTNAVLSVAEEMPYVRVWENQPCDRDASNAIFQRRLLCEYPPDARDLGLSATVRFSYIVNRQGSMESVRAFFINDPASYTADGFAVLPNGSRILAERYRQARAALLQATQTQLERVQRETNGNWVAGRQNGRTVLVQMRGAVKFQVR